jgi:hypothetical protein
MGYLQFVSSHQIQSNPRLVPLHTLESANTLSPSPLLSRHPLSAFARNLPLTSSTPLASHPRPIQTSHNPRHQPSNTHSLTPKPTADERQSTHHHRHRRTIPNAQPPPRSAPPSFHGISRTPPQHIIITITNLANRIKDRTSPHRRKTRRSPAPSRAIARHGTRKAGVGQKGNQVPLRCLLARRYAQAERGWAGLGRDGMVGCLVGWYLSYLAVLSCPGLYWAALDYPELDVFPSRLVQWGKWSVWFLYWGYAGSSACVVEGDGMGQLGLMWCLLRGCL